MLAPEKGGETLTGMGTRFQEKKSQQCQRLGAKRLTVSMGSGNRRRAEKADVQVGHDAVRGEETPSYRRFTLRQERFTEDSRSPVRLPASH
jgi:hypothetical protein